MHINGEEMCEFCERMTLPWPTVEEQETTNPEEVITKI